MFHSSCSFAISVTMFYGGGGAVSTGTNSNEHPRLDSVSDSRFRVNLTNSNRLSNDNFICSSFVKLVSIVNVCEPLKNKINVITTNDANILNLSMINNIHNINPDNLTTIDNISVYKLIGNSNINTNMPSPTTSSLSLPDLDFNEYSAKILPWTRKNNNSFPNPLVPSSLINVITVPPKFWRKKPINKYNPVPYDDVDEDLYLFKSFGKSIKRTQKFSHRPRSDLIIWDKLIDNTELVRDLHIGQDIDVTIRQSIITIIQDNWDSFCKRGVSLPMLDFEFCIDTGSSPPVCCRQPVYGFQESKIMNKLLDALENSGRAWGSLLLLAAKPHQESCDDINSFIWRLCVSYCSLNSITLSFQFPIHRCEDSIEALGDSCGPVCKVSLDARSGYHQIRVRNCDQEKLAFFTLSGEKKTYNVLPFGPTNDPGYYTAMMQSLRKEWLLLFATTKYLVRVTSPTIEIMCADKIIIDDILLYSNHVPIFLVLPKYLPNIDYLLN